MDSIYQNLTYFAFFQCLFLIFIFIVSPAKRKKINIYLFILVGLLLIGLIGNIGHHTLEWRRKMKGLSEFAILFFGPTVYFFVQSVLSTKKFETKDLVHFVPGVMYSTIVTFYYILASPEVINERILSGELTRVVRILVGIGLTVNITYYFLSIQKYNLLKSALQEDRSYVPNISFIRNFLVAIGISLLIWLTIYLISFGSYFTLEVDIRPFIWITIALLVLFIAFYQMSAPEVFQFEVVPSSQKYIQSKLSIVDLDRLKNDLEQVMINKKPYLNSKLLKSELAEIIGLNAPELSRLLNEHIGMTFFEFVNYHRIHEFIRLAKTSAVENKTLLGLAQEAGFNSKTTFNKSFKQIMGCPPSVYLKNQI